MFKKLTGKECYNMRSSITAEDQTEYARQKGLYQMAYLPDLENPKTLNEKIIWLALNYRNPQIKVASDKISAKEWISERIGDQYVVPLIKVYDKVSDIDLNQLPDRFVIKSNCGWAAKTVSVVTDKKDLLDGNGNLLPEVESQLNDWLSPWNNYYYNNMCIGEENITPRLLVEELLGDGSAPLADYKLFVFNGKAQFFYVVEDRNGASQTKTFLDLDWNLMPCHRYDVPSANMVSRPECVDEMIDIGQRLADGFPLVRVDFYYVDSRLYVGEMTFTPGMFLSIEPKEWDLKLGQLLELPI